MKCATMSMRRVSPKHESASLAPSMPELTLTSPSVDAKYGLSEFEKLSAVEQSVASLGVAPDEWKPISFLNNGHYKQLRAANMLDDNLARRIEAYRSLASASN